MDSFLVEESDRFTVEYLNEQMNSNTNPVYHTDLDFMYNVEERNLVASALSEIGLSTLEELFHHKKVDYEAFIKLDQVTFNDVLENYPPGIRLKCYHLYKGWWMKKFANNELESVISSRTISFKSSSNSLVQSCIDESTFLNIMSTEEGKRFAANHPFDRVLEEEDKRELADLICGILISDEIKIGKRGAEILASSIVKLYKKESAEVYYNGSGGLLYNKSVNLTHKYKIKGAAKGPVKKKARTTATTEIGEILLTSDHCASDTYVKENPLESSDAMLMHWKQSAKKRLFDIRQMTGSLNNITNVYRTYTRSDGYFFVQGDFDFMFPNINFSMNWQNLRYNLSQILPKNSSSGRIKTKFGQFNVMNETSQSLTLLLALHAQLYSRPNIKIKDKNLRETIEDSYEQMISLIESEAALSIQLSSLREKALGRKQSVQPFIFCLGKDIDVVQERFILIFDDFKYVFSNFSLAFEILLKLYYVFNLNFPIASKNVYEFLCYTLLDQQCKMSAKSEMLINLIENVE